MNSAISDPISTRTQHRIATNRSLDTLLGWSAEVAQEEAASGRRLIYAPCHALRGAVSLRNWLLSHARRTLGESAPADAPTLLSGAADTLIIADPASADPASLHWLGDLLACVDAASDIAATPPMPQLVVLVPTGSASDPRVEEFLTRLNSLGSREERVSGRPADPALSAIESEVGGLRDKYGQLLAALALMPCPLSVSAIEQLAKDTRSGAGAVAALTGGTLFRVVGDQVMPLSASVIGVLRDAFSAAELQTGAQNLLGLIEKELDDLPDARVEALLYAGDSRRAVKLARKLFDEHVDDEHYEEALRIQRVAMQLGITLETGKNAEQVDRARLAAMCAATGQHKEARELIDELGHRRELFGTAAFVEWVALAARRLAIDTVYEPRMADSLMRRAIRHAGKNTDQWVRLRLLRVELLRSKAFNLEERADWLLSHVSQKILDKVSQKTLAAYLDEIATRLFAKGDYKGAFKRLRRLGALPTTEERLGRGMLLMARCREHFKDHEAAHRYASSAMHYGLRSAALETVKQAADFLRALEKDRPRRLPRLTPPARGRGARSRLPAAADIPTPQSAEAKQLFEILETRFHVVQWVRRRGANTEMYGEETDGVTDGMNVYQEVDEGQAAHAASSGEPDDVRGITLLRKDGSDLLIYTATGEAETREDAIVQFLLTDRNSGDTGAKADSAPARKAVVDEYMRRALSQGIKRGLHSTMETLFNKDVLIFFEEQGFSKEEMAEKLNVSRATLYRMYARAGLN
ncbi:MAG: hypothetical protein KDB82_12075 [Planctomycetes bacterium]|nr:hypothetical protein [Planctomycetota bacterium]